MLAEQCLGRIFAQESFGTVDGPGIRYVVFLQGCVLNCLYCHNPESRAPSEGEVWKAGDIVQQVLKYRGFIESSGGGLTLSGGEPLVQPKFAGAIIKLAKEAGLHTAIDTSGAVPWQRVGHVVQEADLVLLDIKAGREDLAKTMSGLDLNVLKDFIQGLNQTDVPVWVRHVLVPGYNDDPQSLQEVAELAQTVRNMERFELLPFHQMAKDKWKKLNKKYELENLAEAGPEDVAAAKKVLAGCGLQHL